MERLNLAPDGESAYPEDRKCHPLSCNVLVVESSGESNDWDSSSCNRWRNTATKTLALVATVITGLFYLQLRLPATTSLPSIPANPPPRLVKYDVPSTDATTSPAVYFNVYQPVLSPAGAVDQTIASDGTRSTAVISPTSSNGSATSVVLMDHSFGQSYGAPFVGSYTPPAGDFNRVIMNFTVTSQGRQFDRLAMLYFNDTEVWRTSTEEPTRAGIQWTYIKDMTPYLSMWKESQKIIFDLPNNVDSTYTGLYNTTLTATFFQSNALSASEPADVVIPITAQRSSSDSASLWQVPGDNATSTVSFPRNANRAVFSVSACGQANEEFWWGNVLSPYTDTFNSTVGELFGGSAWREVQILIDGSLAGVQWPFPIIFTGGVLPDLWKPIVGLDAFDLREHEIDITPWLPLLCDGNQHSFEIRVASLADNGEGISFINETSGYSWYVTGKVFVWLDDAGSITTGTQPTINMPDARITTNSDVTKNNSGGNDTLINDVSVTRTVSVSSMVQTKNGNNACSWTQILSFSNNGTITNQGFNQVNYQMTQGTDQSTGIKNYKNTYGYPLFVNTTNTQIGATTSDTRMDVAITRGITLQIEGASVYPTGLEPFSVIDKTASIISNSAGSILNTNANSTGVLIQSSNDTTQYASTAQDFSFGSLSSSGAMGESGSTELYQRFVSAVNGSVARDREVLAGMVVSDFTNGSAVVDNAVVKEVGRRVQTGRFLVDPPLG